MDSNKINDLKKKLEQLEAGLSEHDRKFATDELNALVTDINKDLEEYIRQIKILEAKQSVQKLSN